MAARLHEPVRHHDEAAPRRPRRQIGRARRQPRPRRDRRRPRHAGRPDRHEPADGRPRLRAAARHAHPCRARPESALRDRAASASRCCSSPAASSSSASPIAAAPTAPWTASPRSSEAHGFAADEIEAIHVRAPVTHLNNLMYTDPEDALQAKFSLEYAPRLHRCVTGNCTLADFTDEAAAAPGDRARSIRASTATPSTRPRASSRPRSRSC